jgi:hypothetical protein
VGVKEGKQNRNGSMSVYLEKRGNLSLLIKWPSDPSEVGGKEGRKNHYN